MFSQNSDRSPSPSYITINFSRLLLILLFGSLFILYCCFLDNISEKLFLECDELIQSFGLKDTNPEFESLPALLHEEWKAKGCGNFQDYEHLSSFFGGSRHLQNHQSRKQPKKNVGNRKTISEKGGNEMKSEHSKLWIPPWNPNGPRFNGYGPGYYDFSMVTRYVEKDQLGKFVPKRENINGHTRVGTLSEISVMKKCNYTQAEVKSSPPWNDCTTDSMQNVYMAKNLIRDGKSLMGCLSNSSCMDVWINSPGGVGSNLLWNYFRDHGVSAGERAFPWGKKLCHIAQPLKLCDVPFVKKAIVLYGDPCTALFSVFRRNIQRQNAEKANLQPLTRNQLDAIKSLSSYLKAQMDVLQLESHFDNWTSQEECLGYPILFIKFGPALWENLDKILKFLGIPDHLAKEMKKDLPPMRERKTSQYREGKVSLDRCKDMYSSLYEKFNSFPDIALIQV
mmetsp:Transcript_33955/g.44803  ORF Transcript_33955/g.44803 Transcript_33955/m.44803 type:complete len:451 (+) Transcript_33955:209-1561(+)